MNFKDWPSEDLLGLYLFLTVVPLREIDEDFFKEVLTEASRRPELDLDLKFKKVTRARWNKAPKHDKLAFFLKRAYDLEKESKEKNKDFHEAFETKDLPTAASKLSLLIFGK